MEKGGRFAVKSNMGVCTMAGLEKAPDLMYRLLRPGRKEGVNDIVKVPTMRTHRESQLSRQSDEGVPSE